MERKRTSPDDAPFCGDYYRNLTEQEIRENCDLSKFATYEFSTNASPADLCTGRMQKPWLYCGKQCRHNGAAGVYSRLW